MTSLVQVLFTDYEQAAHALSSLKQAGVSAAKLSIVGRDCDQFRDVTSCFQTRKIDGLLIWMPVAGAIIGAYWGMVGCPQYAAGSPSATIAAMMASFCGAIMGLWMGAHTSAIINLDKPPASQATIIAGELDAAKMALSVQTNDDAEAEGIANILLTTGVETVQVVKVSQPQEQEQQPNLRTTSIARSSG